MEGNSSSYVERKETEKKGKHSPIPSRSLDLREVSEAMHCIYYKKKSDLALKILYNKKKKTKASIYFI